MNSNMQCPICGSTNNIILENNSQKILKLRHPGLLFSKLEYVRNRVLVVIGKPNICCIQNLYNYSGDIYKYRVKWFSNSWGNWQTVSLT